MISNVENLTQSLIGGDDVGYESPNEGFVAAVQIRMPQAFPEIS